MGDLEVSPQDTTDPLHVGYQANHERLNGLSVHLSMPSRWRIPASACWVCVS